MKAKFDVIPRGMECSKVVQLKMLEVENVTESLCHFSSYVPQYLYKRRYEYGGCEVFDGALSWSSQQQECLA
jgi:hypothetical protein